MGNHWKAAAATALVALLGTPALAADLVSTPDVDMTPSLDWTGLYVGAEAGYGAGGFAFDNIPMQDSVQKGALAGLEAGTNLQMGAFVLGVEGDVSWSGLTGGFTDNNHFTGDVNVDWLATLTARAGIAADRALFYVEAGAAYGNVHLTGTSTGGPFDETDGATGWTAGAGVELAVADNASVKVEYNYVDLTGSSDWFVDGYDVTANIMKAGVNFRF